MSIYHLFVWANDTAIGSGIRDSLWLFPVIEVFHLLGMAVLGGAVLLVDLRLLGLGLTGVPVPRLAAAAAPWRTASLVVAAVSGVLLFVSEATKCYGNPAFWLKMACLVLALLFTGFVRTRWTRDAPTAPSAASSRAVALISLSLWLGVGVAGRGIGFW